MKHRTQWWLGLWMLLGGIPFSAPDGHWPITGPMLLLDWLVHLAGVWLVVWYWPKVLWIHDELDGMPKEGG